jgi:hypothetical protein
MAATASPRFLLRESSDGERGVALDLLAAAGWSRSRLAEWASSGTVLELYDPADDEPYGAAIVATLDDDTFELLAWACTVDTAEATTSRRLVAAIADALRRSGGRRVLASVGDADAEGLTVLLAGGFRFAAVERDARAAADDRSRDLVWLDQDL